MNKHGRTFLFWAFIALMVLLAFVMAKSGTKETPVELGYTDLVVKVERGEVKDLKIRGEEISGTLKEGRRFTTTGPSDHDFLLQTLGGSDVPITFEEESTQSWLAVVFNVVPFLLLIGLMLFMMRQMQGAGGKAMNFGKSKARLLSESGRRVTFEDVAGVDEAKEELEEIIQFLKDPRKFTRLGGRIPKGVLLMGPPGTGKTLLARAVAGEAGVPFFSISGSDFVEMFVGVGASRVRDLFEQGKKNAPCIIFIDEIDAVGRHRGAGMGGGHDEREQTLNQLLVEMDGFESNEGVIMIAATNRPDVLDPALLRPGRFDRRVVVDAPDVVGRKGVLEVHSRRTPLAADVDLEVIAKGTPGMSGADLENLVNEAALLAARDDKKKIEMIDFEMAKDKIWMGPERRSRVVSESDRKRTAYHEAGHAIVAALLPHSHPVHKVSIVPRGRALGLTHFLPEDRLNYSKEMFESQITTAMGGRAAEEVIFSEVNTGASNDLKQATRIARSMVTMYGMSDKLGPVHLDGEGGEVFLGRDFGRRPEYSEATAQAIDSEVRQRLERGLVWARKLLLANIHILHSVAQHLLEKETMDSSEFHGILNSMNPVVPDGVGYKAPQPA
mgnify:CR=1 FL=1